MEGWQLFAFIIGSGGLASIVNGLLQYLKERKEQANRQGTIDVDYLKEVLEQQRSLLEEYRIESAKDEGRIDKLEKEVEYLREDHRECQTSLSAERTERQRVEDKAHALEMRVHVLEARVAELGG